MSKLITIKRAKYSTKLAIAKSYLEDHEIACSLKNEFMAMGTSFFGDMNSVELQVREEDAEEAIKLLAEGGFNEAE